MDHSKARGQLAAPVRRIVTTKSATGRSRVLFDSDAPKTITVLTELWRSGVADLAIDADASLGHRRAHTCLFLNGKRPQQAGSKR
jgi:hypothetical protein